MRSAGLVYQLRRSWLGGGYCARGLSRLEMSLESGLDRISGLRGAEGGERVKHGDKDQRTRSQIDGRAVAKTDCHLWIARRG
jgi:hypothetical protein